MRIVIDTEKELLIVPNSFYKQIDKMNKNIEMGGGTPIDYTEFVKKAFETAVSHPMIRTSDK